jgi:hypothetical protein
MRRSRRQQVVAALDPSRASRMLNTAEHQGCDALMLRDARQARRPASAMRARHVYEPYEPAAIEFALAPLGSD